MQRILSIAILLLALTGCNWVGVTTEGVEVSLVEATEVGNCTRIAQTRSKTLSRFIFQRGAKTLQEELVSLARNDAGGLGGNTIVAESSITEGEQVFGVYTCPSN
jgi:hypothetical protein